MVTIVDATLRQNVYEQIYDTLKAYATEGSYGTTTQPTVTAAYIDDSQSFPQIIISPVDIDREEYNFGQNNPTKEIRVLIDVYTRKNQDIDILSDDLDGLMDIPIAGLNLIGASESRAFENTNQSKIHNKTLTYTYRRK
jgi:hypothetical protein